MKLWRLEAVRGAAAMYVVLGHTLTCRIFSFGQEAVIVFFLLSGFVIEYSSANKLSAGFGAYFKKRFLRIYPILLCLFLVCALLFRVSFSSPEFWRQLCGNLLMLQDFSEGKPNVIVPALFSGALWSLHYEWWFYMFYFPVATRVSPEKQTAFVGIVGIVAVITYLFFPNPLNRLLFYFPVWWLGAAMAREYRATGRVSVVSIRVTLRFLLGISAILAISCAYAFHTTHHFSFGVHPFLELRHLIAAILAVAVAFAWQACGWVGFRLLLFWGTWIAPVSYSLYIAHQPLFAYASYLRGVVPWWLEMPAYGIVLLVFCCATELGLYQRILTRKRTPSVREKPLDAVPAKAT